MKTTFAIPKRMIACVVCKQQFAPLQEIISELSEHNQEWERKDLCIGCYTPNATSVVWKHQIPTAPSQNAIAKEHLDRAWDLLQVLLHKESKEELEEAFILTLYLARKKILTQKGKSALYEHVLTQEMITLPEVNLDSLSTESIQARLQAKLSLIEVA